MCALGLVWMGHHCTKVLDMFLDTAIPTYSYSASRYTYIADMLELCQTYSLILVFYS